MTLVMQKRNTKFTNPKFVLIKVSKSEWWHIMLVIVPNNVEVTDTALLWITGGDKFLAANNISKYQ